MKQNNKNTYLDLCVCCGSIIPEGKMVCAQCEKQIYTNEKKNKKSKSISFFGKS